jgi:thioredoxin reductase
MLQIMLARARNNPKIKFIENAVILRWTGSEKGVLSGFVYKDIITDEVKEV